MLKIFLGLLGGVIGGMGMGGGTLTIPLLTLALSFSQISAQGINLIAFLPMSIVALMIHSKNKLVEYRTAIPFAIVGCVFSIFGSVLANHISSTILKKLFAVFLIGLGVYQIIQTLKVKNDN